MNVTELARRLRIPTKELLDILPAVGFDIGRRAIKIDDRVATKIIQSWPRLAAEYKGQLNALALKEKETRAALPAEARRVVVPSLIRVKDFAVKLNMPLSKVIAQLMKNGVLSSMNEQIDFDTASIIGQDFGFDVVADSNPDAAEEEAKAQKMETLLATSATEPTEPRPPVVVVMGHVDHGKTSLLDAIRTTNVAGGESGGITQHIGAYQVEKKNRLITFIDTPGHEAFTTMRSRGARVADIAILVVAADDGVQPQTKESIKIIKSAQLPMIVAINKIDKADINIERVKQELAALDLIPEDWGGKTICVPISARKGTGLEDLLDMVLLVADTEKERIVATPNRAAVGTIVESRVDKGEGPIATVLVQNGTLRRGDLITVGDSFYGKIRGMKDFAGRDVAAATPSMPVKIIGLKAAPSVGDILHVTDVIDRKTQVTSYKLREQATAPTHLVTQSTEANAVNQKTLNIILRADVLGSLEAIVASLHKIEHPEVAVNIIAKGLGNITEADIQRGETGNAMILGFHAKPTLAAEQLAREKKVVSKSYDVIYQLLDDVKKNLEALLTPEVIRTTYGRLKVLAVFHKEKDGVVVGGQVVKGKVVNASKIDVMRNDQVIATGTLAQLQYNKVSANEVEHGRECGIRYQGKAIIEVGDYLESYSEQVREKKIS